MPIQDPSGRWWSDDHQWWWDGKVWQGYGSRTVIGRGGHSRIVLAVAIAAPILSVAALGAQFIPGGVESCTSTTEGGSSVCQSLPAISAWAGPLPYAIAAALILLSLAPLASVLAGRRLPAVASAILQALPQVMSFGGFIAWAPVLVATIVVAIAMSESRRRATAPPPMTLTG